MFKAHFFFFRLLFRQDITLVSEVGLTKAIESENFVMVKFIKNIPKQGLWKKRMQHNEFFKLLSMSLARPLIAYSSPDTEVAILSSALMFSFWLFSLLSKGFLLPAHPFKPLVFSSNSGRIYRNTYGLFQI